MLPFLFSWRLFSRRALRISIKDGNYFHLYGHSWELEKYGMWDELEGFLKYVKSFDCFEYVTNKEILELFKNENTNNKR